MKTKCYEFPENSHRTKSESWLNPRSSIVHGTDLTRVHLTFLATSNKAQEVDKVIIRFIRVGRSVFV